MRVNTYLTRYFATFILSVLQLSFAPNYFFYFHSSFLSVGIGQASDVIPRLLTSQRPVFLVNSRSLLSFSPFFWSLFLPKLLSHFAQFLNHYSPISLSILYLFPCVSFSTVLLSLLPAQSQFPSFLSSLPLLLSFSPFPISFAFRLLIRLCLTLSCLSLLETLSSFGHFLLPLVSCYSCQHSFFCFFYPYFPFLFPSSTAYSTTILSLFSPIQFIVSVFYLAPFYSWSQSFSFSELLRFLY